MGQTPKQTWWTCFWKLEPGNGRIFRSLVSCWQTMAESTMFGHVRVDLLRSRREGSQKTPTSVGPYPRASEYVFSMKLLKYSNCEILRETMLFAIPKRDNPWKADVPTNRGAGQTRDKVPTASRVVLTSPSGEVLTSPSGQRGCSDRQYSFLAPWLYDILTVASSGDAMELSKSNNNNQPTTEDSYSGATTPRSPGLTAGKTG